MNTRRALRVLAFATTIAGTLPASGAVSTAHATLTGPELQCRTTLARASRHYFDGVHRTRQSCLHKIYLGKISPVTDCIHGSADASLKRVEALRAALGVAIPRGCLGADLTKLGFPGSCATSGPFDVVQLENCVASVVDRAVIDMLEVESPSPGVLQPRDLPCVTAVGRNGHAMVKREVRGRQRCLIEQDRGRAFGEPLTCRAPLPPYGPGTGMDDADSAILDGYVSVLAGIPAGCRLARPDQIGLGEGCEDSTGDRFTTFDLKLCVFLDHQKSAQRILDAAFPRTPECGNGELEGDEACDDGNTKAGDGCSDRCATEFCGDAVVQAGLGEQCDNGAANSDTKADACRSTCKNPRCGDNVTDTGEACDPPNGTTCSATCKALLCGNGRLDTGEQCDNGSANSNTTPDACRTNCTLPRCGDGVTDPSKSEACDDGNTVQTDACLNSCKSAKCGDGFVRSGSEECDDGNTVQTDACLNSCKNAKCGDGFVRSGSEECDDANTVQTDKCLTTCKNATCGDGFTCSSAGCTSGPSGGVEKCDAGAANSNTTPNACRKSCALAGCGDGVVDSGEECDGAAGACPGGAAACNGSCACANECPGSGELTVLSGDGQLCAGDQDCLAGSCILGRCRTSSRLDTGMTGLAHGADITDHVIVPGFLECGGVFPCGVCQVTGINSASGLCRCANDNRKICDNKFAADNDDCAGEICNCYFGPPLALSSGNTPACVVNRFAEDVSGTANVDEGSGAITTRLRSMVFLGEELARPCPYCTGDPTPNDGVRGGTCVLGPNDGQSCDVDAFNTTFPAPDGDGHSIDCFPSEGKGVSGQGLRIELTQTTGRQELKISGDAVCGFPAIPTLRKPCWCLQCSGDPNVSCTTNAQCEALGIGKCNSAGGASLPASINQCDDSACAPVDGSEILGECATGPDDHFCDAILRANGEGYIQCQSNADCSPDNIGMDAGACTQLQRRPCFLDPIVSVGAANPSTPLGGATFCVPPTSSPGINQVAGLPGPARVLTQVRSRLFCADDPNKQYTPGVGGCGN